MLADKNVEIPQRLPRHDIRLDLAGGDALVVRRQPGGDEDFPRQTSVRQVVFERPFVSDERLDVLTGGFVAYLLAPVGEFLGCVVLFCPPPSLILLRPRFAGSDAARDFGGTSPASHRGR